MIVPDLGKGLVRIAVKHFSVKLSELRTEIYFSFLQVTSEVKPKKPTSGWYTRTSTRHRLAPSAIGRERKFKFLCAHSHLLVGSRAYEFTSSKNERIRNIGDEKTPLSKSTRPYTSNLHEDSGECESRIAIARSLESDKRKKKKKQRSPKICYHQETDKLIISSSNLLCKLVVALSCCWKAITIGHIAVSS